MVVSNRQKDKTALIAIQTGVRFPNIRGEMSVSKYGTYNDYTETTRLLNDSVRIASETEAIGTCCLVICI